MTCGDMPKDLAFSDAHGYRQMDSQPCFCIGPQNGEPFCRCKMRGVLIRDGRYIMPERDLGPVRPKPDRSTYLDDTNFDPYGNPQSRNGRPL